MTLQRLLRPLLLPVVVLALGLAPIVSAQQPATNTSGRATSSTSAAAKPESLGFSSERLERLHTAMQQEIDAKKTMAGAVTLLMRHGKLVDLKAYGKKDLASGATMTTDTIFRAFSMTKVVTGVAMMILYEQGKWNPQDPVSKYIPEFTHLKVFKGVDANGKMIVEDPAHPPTMHELMTHTAGFSYGLFGDGPVDKAYQSVGVLSSKNLQEMIDKLTRIPLLYQPGTKWVYSVSMDVQGYIIEKLSGQPLPDFMHDHIFAPLNMKDSGFYVPKEKWDRFATLYGEDSSGALQAIAPTPTLGLGDYKSQPTMPSGGGGMVSTAQDYSRFAQMLLNGGELDGVRILAPATVQLMSANHLPPRLMTGEFSIGPETIRPGMGWGYDCAVFTDPSAADEIVGKGTFFWLGAADTWFWIDPTNDIVFVGMTQHMIGPNQPNVEQISRPAVYQALLNPKK
ncbi:MAG TPA: serine hydrolase domain-containing protein [Candidatus Acidoferrum sp.]|jgi:CubicO group peptidase (beta-lactamase class C family)|nr:serine hydrolase domain-containing protein [Candidatus Acidoferrum sp.]